MKRGVLLLYFLTLRTLFPLWGDPFQGSFRGALPLMGWHPSLKGSLELGLGEIVEIDDTTTDRLLEAIEIRIDLPRDLLPYRSGFVLYLFKAVTPSLKEGVEIYEGEQVLVRLLSSKSPIMIRVPFFMERHPDPLKRASSPHLPHSIQREEMPLALTIFSIMKDVPESVKEARFSITATPEYSNKGILRLLLSDLSGDPQEEILLEINTKSTPWHTGPYLLEEGLHSLLIKSSLGEEAKIDFMIHAGEETIVHHRFQYPSPLITVAAPEGVVVLLDDVPLEKKQRDRAFEVSPGDHIIIFQIGDYRISREFSIHSGEKLSISTFLDTFIQNR